MKRGGTYSGHNRRGRIAVAPHAHPLVRQFDTMRFWQWRHMPRVDLLDAALNALDLELVIRPIGTRDRDLERIERRAVA